jgi:hypothetical protein
LNQPEPPRQRIGVVRFLLIAVVVVIASSLFLVMTMCSSMAMERPPVGKRAVGLGAAALALMTPRWVFGRAADWVRNRPYYLLAVIAALALAWWLA